MERQIFFDIMVDPRLQLMSQYTKYLWHNRLNCQVFRFELMVSKGLLCKVVVLSFNSHKVGNL